jgi:hypothetical protein
LQAVAELHVPRTFDDDRAELAVPAERLVNLAALGVIKTDGMFSGSV